MKYPPNSTTLLRKTSAIQSASTTCCNTLHMVWRDAGESADLSLLIREGKKPNKYIRVILRTSYWAVRFNFHKKSCNLVRLYFKFCLYLIWSITPSFKFNSRIFYMLQFFTLFIDNIFVLRIIRDGERIFCYSWNTFTFTTKEICMLFLLNMKRVPFSYAKGNESSPWVLV